MGKRKADNLLSPSEIRQSTQHHYEGYIKDDQRKQRMRQTRRITTASVTVSAILTDPSAMDARKCYECECINDKGFCDNYLLYAVMRQMCRVPVEGGYQA